MNIHEENLEPLTDAVDGSGEMMHEMLELRKEIVDVKLQMLEMKEKFSSGKKVFVMDTSIVAAICMGVVIGVLVSLVLK